MKKIYKFSTDLYLFPVCTTQPVGRGIFWRELGLKKNCRELRLLSVFRKCDEQLECSDRRLETVKQKYVKQNMMNSTRPEVT